MTAERSATAAGPPIQPARSQPARSQLERSQPERSDRNRRPRTPPTAAGELRGLFERLGFALRPLGVGLLLDLLDFATFGPVGLVLGPLVGGTAGWMLGRHEAMDRDLRLALAFCTAAYMTLPFTEFVPAATVLFLLARFFVGPQRVE